MAWGSSTRAHSAIVPLRGRASNTRQREPWILFHVDGAKMVNSDKYCVISMYLYIDVMFQIEYFVVATTNWYCRKSLRLGILSTQAPFIGEDQKSTRLPVASTICSHFVNRTHYCHRNNICRLRKSRVVVMWPVPALRWCQCCDRL